VLPEGDEALPVTGSAGRSLLGGELVVIGDWLHE
jgi:hypothetical protein